MAASLTSNNRYSRKRNDSTYRQGKTVKLEPLSAKHTEAAKFIAAGAKNRVICEMLEIGETTLLRWKRRSDFQQLVKQFVLDTPKGDSELSQKFEQYSIELLENARRDEELLMVQLREILEKFAKILETRLESLSEGDMAEIPVRLLPSFFSSFTDGIANLQAAHDRLTGYGILTRELNNIIEAKHTTTNPD
ncbi:hypothetical protein ACQ4N7_29990 [Nodosilinea sp. AN01ver1]|uniref:hypothetical protein n=1 Tax=Nodosilinea sp. AN01ver1 TaxID=3423362 RepID=UPI003D319051